MRKGQTLGEWSRKKDPMRDEGDMMSEPVPAINCRALIIASVIAWSILALMAILVLKLFQYV